MKIIVAHTAGFCMGVKRAVDYALTLSEDRSAATYTLGPLIHNKQTIDMLKQRGVSELDESAPELAITNSRLGTANRDQSDDVRSNVRAADSRPYAHSGNPPNLLIRAHGVPPGVIEKYAAMGYNIVDGTCPKVKTVHKVIGKHRDLGYDIVVTGDEGHAEVIGLMGYAGDKGHLIQKPEDVDALPAFDKICLVSQTTFDRTQFDVIAERLKARFPDAEIVVKKTICSATDQRQEETAAISRSVDALIVVGGKNSANTQRLAHIAAENGARAQAVETEEEIDWEPLAGCKAVGVTAGASTPNWMIKRVCDHLQFLSHTREKNAMGRIMRLLDAAANLNLFVAVGAVAAYYVSCVAQDMAISLTGGVIALLYFMSMYLWNSLTSLENTLHLDISKYRFYNRYRTPLFCLSSASIVTMLAIAWFTSRPAFYLMLFAGITGSAYHTTIIPKKLRAIFPYKSLKDIPLSRDLFVALAWATILTFLPQTISGTLTVTPAAAASFAVIFMLSFIRSLIFDLRDIEGDRIMGRETLITRIGEKRARKAIAVMVWGCVLLLVAAPSVMGFTGHAKALPFLFQAPALAYAAVFVRLNARIRPNHSALFCILADGLFYIAAAGAFLSKAGGIGSARVF